MKTSTLSVLFIIVMAMGFTLDEAFGGEMKAFKATFEQVQTACDNTAGCELTINPDGSYGAETDDSWIDCTTDGDCIGGNVEARRSPAVVDWNKATKTTFVGIMSTQSRRKTNCPNILAKVRVLDQKSRGLIAKLGLASKSTAIKSLIRRSRSANSARSSKMAKLKAKARAKMLGKQRHLAALTSQLNRNTKQRTNLWRQCNARMGVVRPRAMKKSGQTQKLEGAAITKPTRPGVPMPTKPIRPGEPMAK